MDEQTPAPSDSYMPAPPVTALPEPEKSPFPSAWSLFKPSIKAIIRNFWSIFALAIVPSAVVLAALLLGAVSASASHTGATTTSVVVVILGVALGIALFIAVAPAITLAILHGARGEKVKAGVLFRAGKPLIWRYLCLSLLVGLILLCGFILLFVPYLFLLKRYMLAPYYLVDENLSVREAMHKSTQASHIKGALWGVVGIYMLFSLIGIIPLVGLIGSIASLLYTAAPAVRYLQVRSAQGGAAGTAQPTANQPAPFAQQFDHLS